MKSKLWVFMFLLILPSLLAEPLIEEEIETVLQQEEAVSVIVVLEDVQKNEVKSIQQEVLNNLNENTESLGILPEHLGIMPEFEVENKYSLINGFSGEITQEGLDKLKEDERVKNIFINEEKHIFLDSSVPIINAPKVWNLSYNGIAIDGSGETVCMVDTGVNYNHSALGSGLGNKVLGGYDFVNDDNDPLDDHGHGTHVSGIVGSTDSTYRGVAPGAKILSMKVCNAAGSCSDADVLAGIERCIQNSSAYNVSVISISLGGGQFDNYCDGSINSQYSLLINEAVKKNISVVVATGNTDSIYTNPTAGIAAPACVQNSTKVTATNDNDQIPSFAFRHSAFPEIIAAPGVSITSTVGSSFAALSGTSMSTPHISGAFALLQQFNKLHKGSMLTPAQLEQSIRNTGVLIDDSAGSGISYSRADVLSALYNLDNVAPQITFISPSQNVTISNGKVIINISSNEPLNSAILQLNNVNYSMNSAGNSYSAEFSNLLSNDYNYLIYSTDLANNSAVSESRQFTFDGTPIINLYLPLNNSHYNSHIQLNVTASDLNNLSSVEYEYYLVDNDTLKYKVEYDDLSEPIFFLTD